MDGPNDGTVADGDGNQRADSESTPLRGEKLMLFGIHVTILGRFVVELPWLAVLGIAFTIFGLFAD